MVKPRENRVPIMMSEDELTAVDDWRFQNRIATRSDAIRRLTASGLKLHEGAESYADRINKLAEEIARLEDEVTKKTYEIIPYQNGDIDMEKLTKQQMLKLFGILLEVLAEASSRTMTVENENRRYIQESLSQSHKIEFGVFATFSRMSEWLRGLFGMAGEGK